MVKTTVLLGWLILAFSGCTFRVTDFTAISTKNVNLPVVKGERVRGEDCAYLLFGFIPITGTFRPDFKEAIDRAIQSGKGELLIDGVVYNHIFVFPLLWMHACYTVEGTVASVK
jgi:hypothetical protein